MPIGVLEEDLQENVVAEHGADADEQEVRLGQRGTGSHGIAWFITGANWFHEYLGGGGGRWVDRRQRW